MIYTLSESTNIGVSPTADALGNENAASSGCNSIFLNCEYIARDGLSFA
jgi:hypothetical protein